MPFLLVFVVVFAILQKSKILGEGKAQIDALVSLAIGLMLIAIPAPRDFIVQFLPWVAVGVAVLLVFFLLYGFVAGDLSGTNMKGWMKVVFGILAAIFTVGVILYVTGFWDNIIGWFTGGSSELWMSIVSIVAIVLVVIFVLWGTKGANTPAKS